MYAVFIKNKNADDYKVMLLQLHFDLIISHRYQKEVEINR